MKKEEINEEVVMKYLQEKSEQLRRQLTATEATFKLIEYLNSQSEKLEELAVEQAQYDPNWTYAEKILFIIKEKGEAYTKDLTKYIADKEPDLNKKSLPLTIGKIAQRMVASKQIKVTKDGNANKYSLS